MKPIKLPTEEQLNGMRFGKWLFGMLQNYACDNYILKRNVEETLFYISNKDLQKIINKLCKPSNTK